MVEKVKTDADTYLRSGSNELKVLEFKCREDTYGINILKVSRVLSDMSSFTVTPDAHPAMRGVFQNHDRVIPVLDLKYFLYGEYTSLDNKHYRVIVTEFFGIHNAFLVEHVEAVHTVLWEKVINAHNVLDMTQNPYVISIVRPTEEQMIMMLDYETILIKVTPEQVKMQKQKGKEVAPEGHNQTVLIADDSSSIREMLQLELEELNFQVLVAHDGSEAWDIINENKDIDMVISDVEMPQTDGLALTKLIKENPETSHIPVIVYSSIGDPGMKERAKYLKAEEHITKLNLDELFQKMQGLLTFS